MTKRDCMTYTAQSEKTSYLFPVASHTSCFHIAEDSDDYDVKPSTVDSLSLELKRVELRALRTAASAQIGRLYRLANLLLEPETIDHSKDVSIQISLEVRNAASILEESLHAIVGSIIDDPEPSEEEIAE